MNYQNAKIENRYGDHLRPKTALNKQSVYADRQIAASQKLIKRRETLANQSQKISALIEMSLTKQSQTNTKTKASLDVQSGIAKESVLRKNSSFVHGGRKLV